MVTFAGPMKMVKPSYEAWLGEIMLKNADRTYTELQLKIFRDRYAVGDEQYPHECWARVSYALAADRNELEEFYWLLEDFRYVPAGRVLLALGNPAITTAMNCYVLPSPVDSIHGIVHTWGEWIQTQAMGGGVGMNISSLRPRGFNVGAGKLGETSGSVNWAEPFAFVSHSVIIQGGSRRGAAMIMLDDHHPDLLEFIDAKRTPGKLEGANLSVCISNAFMEAVKSDDLWELWFDLDGERVHTDTMPARTIWKKIIEAAHASGEPGIYFMERANELANSQYFEKLVSTNPCGEQPLGPYGACLLGSINLGHPDGVLHLNQITSLAVRFNDRIIDNTEYPLPEQQRSQKNIRRMGIGVMGLADYLLQHKIRYGSKKAIRRTESIFKRIFNEAYAASALLAMDTMPFPRYTRAYLDMPMIQKLHPNAKVLIEKYGIRNCYLISQAPTGTIALLAGVNSGIEPYFDFRMKRTDRTGSSIITTDWAERYNSDKRPSWLVAANDVTPEEHVKMQAAVQRWCDSSVSKTVNAPYWHTVADTAETYMLAWEMGLKSIAYYRDGSRNEQVLEHVDKPDRHVIAEEYPSRGNGITDGEFDEHMDKAIHVGDKQLWRNMENGVWARRDDETNGWILRHDADDRTAIQDAIDSVASGERFVILDDINGPPADREAVKSWFDAEYHVHSNGDQFHGPHPGRKYLPVTRNSITHKFLIDTLGDRFEGYITLGYYPDSGELGEVFLSTSKQGTFMDSIWDFGAMNVSISLQYGVPIDVFTDKWKGTKFTPSGMTNNPDIPSCTSVADYLARFIEHNLTWEQAQRTVDAPSRTVMPMQWEGSFSTDVAVDPLGLFIEDRREHKMWKPTSEPCPSCNNTTLRYSDGCTSCGECGWEKC